MTGVITEIFNDNVPARNGKPEIKKVVLMVDFFTDSMAIEFTGELRRTVIRGFKVNDRIDVDFVTRASRNKNGKPFNNKKATAIKRL